MNIGEFHKIKFWGVRGSFPSPRPDTVIYGGHTSCVEIRSAANDLIILDMGTGMIDLGKSLKSDSESPRSGYIFLSHYHWDHVMGFPGFEPLFDPEYHFKIYGKKDQKTPKTILQHIQNPTFWPVDLSMMDAKFHMEFMPDSALSISDNISVRHVLHGHPNGTNSYIIDLGGKTIMYTTDIEHPESKLNPIIIKNAKNVDILIHDAHFTEDELQNHRGWGHSSWQQAVSVAKEAQVKQLILFHHDPFRSDEQLQEIELKAQKLFPNTLVARQGMELSLPQAV